MLRDVVIRSRGYLPHWEREGGTYFVTFRLAGTLPQSVLKEWAAERQRLIASAAPASGRQGNCRQDVGATQGVTGNRRYSVTLARQLRRLFSEKLDAYLDAGHGDCWLAQPRIAELVQNALRHFDGERYELTSWCIMPNHVHCVFTPLEGHSLAAAVHSWKSYTALHAHRMLGRSGQPFWQKEPYDHLIRGDEDLFNCVLYTEQNPVNAKLCAKAEDWPWSSASHRADRMSALRSAVPSAVAPAVAPASCGQRDVRSLPAGSRRENHEQE